MPTTVTNIRDVLTGDIKRTIENICEEECEAALAHASRCIKQRCAELDGKVVFNTSQYLLGESAELQFTIDFKIPDTVLSGRKRGG